MPRELSMNRAAIYKRSLRERKAAGDTTDLRRKYVSEEERREARREARRQAAQRLRRARGVSERAPKAEKPIATDRQAVKRRTVVRDLLSRSPADLRFASPQRSGLPDTDAWIAANEGKTDEAGVPLVQRLPIDAPWTTAETLSASHRKTIEGMR